MICPDCRRSTSGHCWQHPGQWTVTTWPPQSSEKPLLLPDDDTAVERLAAALDGRTAWHRKRDATLIIERLREGGQR